MGCREISREDWERVSDIGLRLINLSADEEDAEEYALVKSEMLAYLEELNRKYGPHPWIYDTIADNLPAGPAVLSWRLQAYELCDVDDLGEKIMIAQDICRYYLSD